MADDKPPQDEEILAVIAASDDGVIPSEIIDAFKADYDFPDIIEAIQRVFDRGLVELSSGARLVLIQHQRQAYA